MKTSWTEWQRQWQGTCKCSSRRWLLARPGAGLGGGRCHLSPHFWPPGPFTRLEIRELLKLDCSPSACAQRQRPAIEAQALWARPPGSGGSADLCFSAAFRGAPPTPRGGRGGFPSHPHEVS